MARAYSQDLRDRVIDAVTSGKESRHSAARRFGVSPSSAIKWVQHYERHGSRCDRGTGGHRPSPVRQHRAWLLAQVNADSSLTLRWLCDRLRAEHGVRADPGILSRFFRAEGISFKKKRAACRAGSARRGTQANTLAAIPEAD
jgi:transposase